MYFHLFFAYAIATISPALAKPSTVDDLKAQAVELINQCKTTAGASDADVEAMKTHQLPESHEGLCMLACVFEAAHFMKAGKFDKDGMIGTFEPLMKDQRQEELKKGKELVETCANEIGDGDADKCVNAKLIVECLMKNAPNHGFDLPDPHAK